MQILLLGLEVFPVSLVLTLMLTQIILPRLVRAHAGQMIWRLVLRGTKAKKERRPWAELLLFSPLS